MSLINTLKELFGFRSTKPEPKKNKPALKKAYDHIKPGDSIVAKVDGSILTCHVYAVGEKIILVIPIRTHRFALYPPTPYNSSLRHHISHL